MPNRYFKVRLKICSQGFKYPGCICKFWKPTSCSLFEVLILNSDYASTADKRCLQGWAWNLRNLQSVIITFTHPDAGLASYPSQAFYLSLTTTSWDDAEPFWAVPACGNFSAGLKALLVQKESLGSTLLCFQMGLNGKQMVIILKPQEPQDETAACLKAPSGIPGKISNVTMMFMGSMHPPGRDLSRLR